MGHVHAVARGELRGHLVARVDVANHAHARVAREHPREPALGAVGAGISRRQPALAGVAAIVAFVWGVVAGLFLLRALPSLPPTTGLDRFLVILLPVALAIEAEAAANWISGFWLTAERGCVALLAVPVLLHGSVWMEGETPAVVILAAALSFPLTGS